MENIDQRDALRKALAEQDLSSARTLLNQVHSTDVADIAADMLPADAAALLLLLPVRRQAETFEHLDSATQMNLARCVDARFLAALLTEMSHNKRADFFKKLDAPERDALLPAIAHVEREDIRRLSAYPEGTAGSIMTSAYAALKPGLTAQQAIDTLRRESLTKETIYHIYVVDEARTLLGVVSLRELVVADGSALVSDLMQRNVISALASESTESVVEAIADYDLLALPIINESRMLIGIVKVSDAMEVVESERGSAAWRILTGPTVC